MKFETIAEVREFLSQFGIVIYMGNEEEEVILMEMEISDLQEMGLISREEELALRFGLKKNSRERVKIMKHKNLSDER